MKISKLHLKKFRNYDSLEINFNDKLNIIIGNNAQGKTNILESIYFLSITKSFLSVGDKNIMKKGEKFSSVDGMIIDNNKNKKLSILVNENGKRLKVNDKEIKKHSDYIGNLKVIVFSPDNVRILKDGPSNRRRFLNIEISQLYGKYINLLNEFNIILKQRNEYLKIIKNGNFNRSYLDILNEKFVELSIQIYKYRDGFINEINKYIGDVYKIMSDTDGLYIKYITNIKISDVDDMREQLIQKLEASYDKELLYGSTLIGPHRDDFSFHLEDNNLSLYGSQGQIKMAVLSLKLAEIDTFSNICGDNPILLLDDLFSELDIEKRNRIINYLNKDIQTILTTTDLDNIDLEYIKDSYIYKIENGKIIYKNYDI